MSDDQLGVPVTTKNAEQIMDVLAGYLSKSGFMVHCPAHDDRNPSLSVRGGNNGKVLFHCFAGCSQESVLKSLRQLGLWLAERNHGE